VQKIVEKYSSSIAKVREFTETPKVCKELLKNKQVSNQNWFDFREPALWAPLCFQAEFAMTTS